ncbi:probable carboxylesterase 2 [Salvia hispanica]|uniref:probable carboxylesterase 2 n=1 Tax=Salvia hispanica TaxID=49212 RepID=UPI00200920A8|nr:probable carboxylesterase 2 [Salvia hispanica]
MSYRNKPIVSLLPHHSSMADEILHDFFPVLRVYKNGRIERLIGEDDVPPSLDPATGVQSKDVQIAPEINLSARIYLPPNADPSKKLPLLVYYHGGGFVIGSTFSPLYHKHLNHLVAQANVVAVSVNYRLAPEFPLPTAFEDSWCALKWNAEGKEEWINDFADLNRVYLGGDSAGANIAHNMAMQVGLENPEGFNLQGIFLNCPFFGGVDPIGSEGAEEFKSWRESFEKLWGFVCPGMRDRDERWVNPGNDPKLSGLGCRKVIVYVAEKDFLKDRGWYYTEVLSNCGWKREIECIEVAGEDHCFSVINSDSEVAIDMIKKVASFINQ